MIVRFLKNIIDKKYPHFDKEEKKILFLLYALNLTLPLTLVHWIYFYHLYDLPILGNLQLAYICIYLFTYLLSVYLVLNFKLYRFLIMFISTMVLTTPTLLLGKESFSIAGLFLVPLGMMLCFSSKEKGTYLKYLLFITTHFLLFIYWVNITEPFIKINSEQMKIINIHLLLNLMLAAMGISYIYFHENSLMQSNLQMERVKSDKLLLKIFPKAIANRLKSTPESIVDNFKEVTVIFVDIAGFTQFADNMSPKDLVYMLDELFSAFDNIASKYKIEKIKTIGDAYMAVSGLPNHNPEHHINAANFVVEINKLVKKQFYPKHKLQIRVGMHTGSVIAGVIGKSKFSYDLWGSTVNIASRFESHGQIGEIHITKEMKELLKDKFETSFNGVINVKGLGQRESYFLGERLNNRRNSMHLSEI